MGYNQVQGTPNNPSFFRHNSIQYCLKSSPKYFHGLDIVHIESDQLMIGVNEHHGGLDCWTNRSIICPRLEAIFVGQPFDHIKTGKEWLIAVHITLITRRPVRHWYREVAPSLSRVGGQLHNKKGSRLWQKSSITEVSTDGYFLSIIISAQLASAEDWREETTCGVIKSST